MKVDPTPIHQIIASEAPGMASTYRIVDHSGFTVAHFYARGSSEEALANAKAAAVAGDALKALEFVKAFFLKIEDGCLEDDPLTAIRRKHHAPVHRAIDLVLARADQFEVVK